MTTTTHPFERSGLGIAPFKCIGVERRVGPIRTMIAPGITQEVGSPGQPMGTCDHCGTGIADCYIIVDANGKRFVVGSSCVVKTTKEAKDKGLGYSHHQIVRAMREERNNAFRQALRVRLDTDAALRAVLLAMPHPYDNPATGRTGRTALEYAENSFRLSGNAGTRRLAKWLDAL
jgi:hypothetical protein